MSKSSKTKSAFSPTVTRMRQVIKEVMFNPKQGPMKIVAEQGSREYYLRAAIVSLEEALAGNTIAVIQAMRLLLMAEVWRRKDKE